MALGAFSVSLVVKDIKVSAEFYQKLGFSEFGGEIDQGWLILKNGDCVIGLFQGMFERNMLTFNPGWSQDAQAVEEFEDIRTIQRNLKRHGVEIEQEIDEDSKGPASFVVVDPDGNPIMFDQHV